eukprot:TRINITY_DN1307_c0_g1_i1.p2 TRINITY_DN1307_c0_g1~~TRINITY_DN1307_c0_g1_i1.p2  ORF type:complete len:276 (-),score=-2.31 TRINITY_DN1307_c0_g1_i1:404-1231(-)
MIKNAFLVKSTRYSNPFPHTVPITPTIRANLYLPVLLMNTTCVIEPNILATVMDMPIVSKSFSLLTPNDLRIKGIFTCECTVAITTKLYVSTSINAFLSFIMAFNCPGLVRYITATDGGVLGRSTNKIIAGSSITVKITASANVAFKIISFPLLQSSSWMKNRGNRLPKDVPVKCAIVAIVVEAILLPGSNQSKDKVVVTFIISGLPIAPNTLARRIAQNQVLIKHRMSMQSTRQAHPSIRERFDLTVVNKPSATKKLTGAYSTCIITVVKSIKD